MVKYHQKSISAPKTWPLDRKKNVFTVRALPAGQPKEHALPLALFMKNLIKCAHTQKEVKYILHKKNVLVNGTRVRNEKRPVGLFDTVTLVELREQYRLFLNTHGYLTAHKIGEKEAGIKPVRIRGKTDYGKEHCQVNGTDGRNILVRKKETATYKTGDTLLVEVPSNKIIGHLPLEKGCTIFFIGGKAIGKTGTLQERKGTVVHYTSAGAASETKWRHVFVIGKEKPEITLPEHDEQ